MTSWLTSFPSQHSFLPLDGSESYTLLRLSAVEEHSLSSVQVNLPHRTVKWIQESPRPEEGVDDCVEPSYWREGRRHNLSRQLDELSCVWS